MPPPSQKSYPQGRLWMFTWNNYPADWAAHLETCSQHENVQWIGGAPEIAPTTGTPHIQGNVYMHRKVTRPGLEKIIQTEPHIHIGTGPKPDGSGGGLPCNGNVGHQLDYINKENHAVEWGDRPGLAERNVTDDEEIRDLARAGNFDQIREDHFMVWLRHGPALRTAFPVPGVPSLPEIKCYWIYGEPRCGKSTFARNYFTNRFFWNRSFTNYREGQTLIIEDVDPDAIQRIGVQKFKQITDVHSFMAFCLYQDDREIRPPCVVITSNYEIHDCFPRMVDADAIRARCAQRIYRFPQCRPYAIQQATIDGFKPAQTPQTPL